MKHRWNIERSGQPKKHKLVREHQVLASCQVSLNLVQGLQAEQKSQLCHKFLSFSLYLLQIHYIMFCVVHYIMFCVVHYIMFCVVHYIMFCVVHYIMFCVLTAAINSSIFLSISSSSMTYLSVLLMFLPLPWIPLSFSLSLQAPWRIALYRSCSPCSVVHVLTSAMNSSIFLSISSSSMTYRSVSFMFALFWNIFTCFSVASSSSWNFFFLSRSCLLYMSCSLFNFVSLRQRFLSICLFANHKANKI